MPSCIVPICTNNSNKSEKKNGITFHHFPRDETRKLEWTKIIQSARLNDSWRPSNYSVICSTHFKRDCFFTTKGGVIRLKKTALPNENLVSVSKNIDSCSEEEIIRSTTSIDNQTKSLSPAKSNSNVGDVAIPDLDPTFNTPREIKLKSQLRHKEKICERHMRLVKTLRQKNRRLTRKVELLQVILKKLK